MTDSVHRLEQLAASQYGRRLFTADQLRWRSEGHLGSGVAGTAALRLLLGRRQPGATDSGWELRVARILTDAGFPDPVRQFEVNTIDGTRTVDLAYPGPPVLAFEYDSDAWHSGVHRRHRDAARRNALRAAGCIVIEVTPALVGDPGALIRLAKAVPVAVVTGKEP